MRSIAPASLHEAVLTSGSVSSSRRLAKVRLHFCGRRRQMGFAVRRDLDKCVSYNLEGLAMRFTTLFQVRMNQQ